MLTAQFYGPYIEPSGVEFWTDWRFPQADCAIPARAID